jgi:hypothetical protein
MIDVRRWLAILAFAVSIAGCDGESLLLPDTAPQGVEGRVSIGPQCPVLPADGSCPDLAYAAVLDLLEASGDVVGRVRSDTEGRFRVGLQPGQYRIVPRNGDPFPHASPLDITVEPGRWLEIDIVFDTGIR